jgi:nucleolar complex protein 3
MVRKLAFLSQLAVFKDIIPGYRIRPLTDKEKEEKVSQMVQRVRDYEQGLVTVYQSYLQVLEQDIKGALFHPFVYSRAGLIMPPEEKSELAKTALQCLCSLLEELSHFNFRINLMSSIVAHLSKRSWSEVCIHGCIESESYQFTSLVRPLRCASRHSAQFLTKIK